MLDQRDLRHNASHTLHHPLRARPQYVDFTNPARGIKIPHLPPRAILKRGAAPKQLASGRNSISCTGPPKDRELPSGILLGLLSPQSRLLLVDYQPGRSRQTPRSRLAGPCRSIDMRPISLRSAKTPRLSCVDVGPCTALIFRAEKMVSDRSASWIKSAVFARWSRTCMNRAHA